jgi:hypothetical protein
VFRFAIPTVLIVIICAASLSAATITPAPADLYSGWLHMYDLRFDQAHQIFARWEQSHPDDALAPASDAAAYLFSELARLGALESELFVDDAHYENRVKLNPDPRMKAFFDREIDRAGHLADAVLKSSPTDTNALFAKSLTFGLRANFSALIDKEDLTALRFTKEGRPYGERLIEADPKDYDAWLGSGVENYLLSLKPAPVRFLLRLTGSQVDRAKGIEELRLTAQNGHYLEPYAKLLLAVSALRDHQPATARQLLSGLHNRFPDNQLYVRELNRIPAK